MLKKIAGWFLTGGIGAFASIFGDSILKPVTDFLNKRMDAKTEQMKAEGILVGEVTVASINATVEENKIRERIYALQFGWAPFRWLVFFAALGPVLHYFMVFLDSSCPSYFGLGASLTLADGTVINRGGCGMWIPAAPGGYQAEEWKVIAALLGFLTVNKGINTFDRYLETRANRPVPPRSPNVLTPPQSG